MWKKNHKKVSIIIMTVVATMTMQSAAFAAPAMDPFASVGAGELVATAPVEKEVNPDFIFSEILTDDDRVDQGQTQVQTKEVKAEAEVETKAVVAEEAAQETVEVNGEETTVLSADLNTVSDNSVAPSDDQDDQEDDEEELSGAAYGYTNLGIVQVDDHLNIRESAEDGSKIVGKLEGDSGCEILGIEGNKAHITSGSVEGYVSTDYILTGQAALDKAEEVKMLVASVTADGLKLRYEPSTEAKVKTMVAYGEELEVLEEGSDWVAVKYDGEKVYAKAEFVSLSKKLKTALNITELLYGSGVSNVRLDLCEYAKQFLGNPYVWGGESLTKGADCSGYVLSIFKKYGVSLPHSSRAQANCGKSISLSEAKPGDLVFYAKGNRINHVGIYIGGGQIINASSPKTGIRIANVHYRTPVKVVRILND